MQPSDRRVSGQARFLELSTLVAAVILFFAVPAGANTWVIACNLVVFYLLTIRAIAAPERVICSIPSYFSIEVLFLLFSYLIFYYPYQLYILGMTDLTASRYVPYSFVEGTNRAITLATIGMLAFSLGYRAIRAEPCAPDLQHNRSDKPASAEQYFVAISAISSVLLVLLLGAYLLSGWRSAGEGRYTGTTTEGTGVEGISVVIQMLCMVLGALWIYSLAVKTPRPLLLKAGFIVAVVWMGRLLALGDRSSFLLFALVIAGGYFTFVRRASLVFSVTCFAIWMAVYNVVEVLRNIPHWYSSGNILDLLEGSRYYQTASSSSESSFNITTITLRATVETVPNLHDFMYGALKLIQLSTPIPFIGKLFLPYLNLDYTNSADMLGDIVLGPNASWNTGTNVISDSYIDLGIPGVIVVLFLVGLAAKCARNYVAKRPQNAHRVIVYLLALALFAELPRYAIELPIRIISWSVLLSILVAASVRRYGNHRSRGLPQDLFVR